MDSFDPAIETGPTQLAAGTVVAGRYRILRSLGSGGMGAVYLAADIVLGDEKLAIKILHGTLINDPTQKARFLREVQLMRKVNHKNVVRTFDVGTDGDLFYFTMEFVPGVQLEKVIATRKVDRQKIPLYIIQMCEALQAIHSAGVIHRDLKPANILLLDDSTVRITDFGVARPEISTLTAHDEIIGSVCYIAPEIWLGESITPSVDLYALGIIIYEMLTGEVPFDGDAPADLMRAHLDRAPIPPKDLNSAVPMWLNKLVLRLLSKKVNGRPHDAKEVLDYVRLHSENYSPEQSGVHAAVQPFFDDLENKSRILTGKHSREELHLGDGQHTASVVKRAASSARNQNYSPKRTFSGLASKLVHSVAMVASMTLLLGACQYLLGMFLPELPALLNGNSLIDQADTLASISCSAAFALLAPNMLIFLLQLSVPSMLIATATTGSNVHALKTFFCAAVFFITSFLVLAAYFLFGAPTAAHVTGVSIVSAALTAKDQISAVALLSPVTNVYEQIVLGNGLIQNATSIGPLVRIPLCFIIMCLYVGLLCYMLGKFVKEVRASYSNWNIFLAAAVVVLSTIEGSLLKLSEPESWYSFAHISLRLPLSVLAISAANWLLILLVSLAATKSSAPRRGRLSSPNSGRQR